MIKHLYYLLRSDYKTIAKTDFDTDFEKMGLPIDDNTLIVEDVILDYMGMELLNAPTLFTSFSDFKEHLHYSVRANALKLYHLANVYASLTSDYLKSSGGEKRTLVDNETESHSINESGTSKLTKTGTDKNEVSSSGSVNGSNTDFRKYADTPTKVEASSKFVDKYTTEQESNTNTRTESNSQNVDSTNTKNLIDNKTDSKETSKNDSRDRNLTEEKFNTTGLPEVLLNIESLRQGLYNEVKKMENKLMYQLLYDIDN